MLWAAVVCVVGCSGCGVWWYRPTLKNANGPSVAVWYTQCRRVFVARKGGEGGSCVCVCVSEAHTSDTVQQLCAQCIPCTPQRGHSLSVF